VSTTADREGFVAWSSADEQWTAPADETSPEAVHAAAEQVEREVGVIQDALAMGDDEFERARSTMDELVASVVSAERWARRQNEREQRARHHRSTAVVVAAVTSTCRRGPSRERRSARTSRPARRAAPARGDDASHSRRLSRASRGRSRVDPGARS
jgi:hypothetical protein